MSAPVNQEFKPENHLIDIKGKRYLPVAAPSGRKDPPTCNKCGKVIKLHKNDQGKWDRLNLDGTWHSSTCGKSAPAACPWG